MNFSRFRAFVSVSALALASSAHASGSADSSLVSVSGGIAEPSTTTAVFQNPAGLAEIKRTALNTHAFFPESAFKDGEYGGGILYGKGSGFGLTAGATYAPTPSASRAYYGLAVASQALHLSLGAAGFTPISPSGDSTFNLGVSIEPSPGVRLAATARDVSSGPDEYGVGLAVSASNDVDLVGDATFDGDYKRPAVSPGIRVGSQQAALTVSYGFRLDSKTSFHSEEIREGVALAGGIRLGTSANLQVYYNQMSKYGATLSFDL